MLRVDSVEKVEGSGVGEWGVGGGVMGGGGVQEGRGTDKVLTTSSKRHDGLSIKRSDQQNKGYTLSPK